MKHPLNPELLPEKVRTATNPLLQKSRKMAVAAGILPMLPEENVLALYQLSFDEDKEVAEKAMFTLRDMPSNIVSAVVRKVPWPEPIDRIGRLFYNTADVVQSILANRATDNNTVCDIARASSRDIVDIIASNQARLMEHPAIIEAIYMNKNSRMSTVDRLVSFAVRNGIQLEGLACFKELLAAHQAETRTEAAAPAAAPADAFVGEEASDSSFMTAFITGFEMEAKEGGAGLEEGDLMVPGKVGGVFGEFDGSAGSSAAGFFGEYDDAGGESGKESLFGEFDTALEDMQRKRQEEELAEEDKLPIEIQLAKMPISHRIRLATIGTAAHRAVLLLDANKVVSMAAIKSPTITDQEVVRCSQSRAVSDEILRYIASNRDWTKNYFVKVNLINNPKTPLPSAMSFLTHLRSNDLKNVSMNKNVPNALRETAKNMLKRKSAGGKL
jgi:hypothetical protein